jgi:hypothetical protein
MHIYKSLTNEGESKRRFNKSNIYKYIYACMYIYICQSIMKGSLCTDLIKIIYKYIYVCMYVYTYLSQQWRGAYV